MASSCRLCGMPLRASFVDLGVTPLSNAFLTPEQLTRMEPFYPLHAYVCESCLLVQIEQYEAPEHIFDDDYAYFSSYSDSWLRHARAYVDAMAERFAFDDASLVVEIASNDGYLLQYWRERGVPVLGVEPAANVAAAASAKGIPTLTEFFGTTLAERLQREGRTADLVIGNNVFAHVPDLNDFVAGLARVLKPSGVITLEFPHLLRLIEQCQFDTIYHEHFSYFSLYTAEAALARHGLEVFDVEELSTHGGSLRVYASHVGGAQPPTERVARVRVLERSAGLESLDAYLRFAERVHAVKRGLLRFLIEASEAGKRVAGYGAPAKGNTLLNYCGVGPELLEYTVDRSAHKQGRFLPGTRIPIYAPEHIFETRPDYVLVLPWNLIDEIAEFLAPVREWGGKLVVPIPEVRVLP